MKVGLLLAFLPLVASVSLAAERPLLLEGALVHVEPGASPVHASVLIEAGRIAFVGEPAAAEKMAPGARRIALSGAVMYAGWTDAHGHLASLGKEKENLELRDKALSDILSMVRVRAAAVPPGAWIQGRGWDQNLWPGKAFPTAAELSRVSPRNPVVLSRVDGHAVWANELAIEKAGITAQTPDPAGGRIMRDADRRPAGVFVDNAQALIGRAVPPPSREDLERYFKTAFAECARTGLTGVGDASAYERKEIEVLEKLAREGEMPIRVYATVAGKDEPTLDFFLSRPPVEQGNLTVHAVKLFADGALGSRGAALLEDYSDDPGNRGLLVTPPDVIERVAEKCFRSGWQIWTHAIGDRANRLVLDAYRSAENAVHPRDARPRIEHAQVVAYEDFGRFGAESVIASIQPTHATSDMPWAEARLGPRRIGESYAWRKLLHGGARLAGGSDFPVESQDPRFGYYAAVTRQDPSGNPPGGWRPEERLTRSEALALFTTDNAYAMFLEKRRGRVAAGQDADLTIMDRDVTSVSPADILQARILMTIVGGRIVYRARR
jgi:predicted amidohydrolase YtcJ